MMMARKTAREECEDNTYTQPVSRENLKLKPDTVGMRIAKARKMAERTRREELAAAMLPRLSME